MKLTINAMLVACFMFTMEGKSEENLTAIHEFALSMNNPNALKVYNVIKESIRANNYQFGSCNQENGFLKKDDTPQTCSRLFPTDWTTIKNTCPCFCKKRKQKKEFIYPKPCYQYCGISKLVCQACRQTQCCKPKKTGDIFKEPKHHYEKHFSTVKLLNSSTALDMYHLLLDQMKENCFKAKSCSRYNKIPVVKRKDLIEENCMRKYPIGKAETTKACRCFCKQVVYSGTKRVYPKNCYKFCGISKLVCLGCRFHIKCNYVRRSSVF